MAGVGMTGTAVGRMDSRWQSILVRGGGAFLTVLGGLVAITELFAGSGWAWLLAAPVGIVAGSLIGRAWALWPALAGLVAYQAAAVGLDLPHDAGPFWYIAAAGLAGLLVVSVLVGTSIGWRRAPVDAAMTAWRAMRPWTRGGLVAAIAIGLLGSIAYVGYAAWSGSATFTEATVASADCRTPADRYGWTFEAINYDPGEDARLGTANATKSACTVFGAEAGSTVVSSDGIRLAGWYIPAASGAGPAAPTLLIVHGWKSNKSSALDFAPPFHRDYNLVLFDLRNNGQSAGSQTSMGLWEQRDVSRMIDWVATVKQPTWIGIVANSMGGSAALAASVGDQRVRAIILDSVHADWSTAVGNAMEEDFGYPGGIAGAAVMAGVSLRVGGDVSLVDPVRLIPRLGDRPVLLIQGTADQVDPPSEASDRNFRAGLNAGVPIEIAYCRGARHGLPVSVCPTEWASWATSFLARARGVG